jgi:signal transduction histidine kinase/ligand-binding sensor domain-containing protein/AraC-like DNA-binding protein
MMACIKYIFTAILILIHTALFAQVNEKYIGVINDLINNEATAILQDNKGFLWFGTRGGLQRFDGYSLKQLKNDFGKGDNLLSQSIEVLENGKDNIVWIGTKSGGLSSYDVTKGRIVNYVHQQIANDEFNGDYILSILDTDSEKLLIGTWKGFQYLNKKNGKFTILNKQWKTSAIVKDKNGYWLATDKGLQHLNNNLQLDYATKFGYKGLHITSIVLDSTENCLWLGSWEKGIFKFNLNNKTVTNYRLDTSGNNNFGLNNAYKVFLDSKDKLWVGTWGGGLHIFDKTSKIFKQVNLELPGLYTKDNKIILSIQEDKSGLLWVGTDGAGIFKFDLNQKKFYNISYTEVNAVVNSTHVISVFVDKFNKLWMGTKGGGIHYTTDWKTFNSLPALSAGGGNKKSTRVSRSFLEDDKYLWCGTDRGLLRIDNANKGFNTIDLFLPDSTSTTALSDRKITALAKDSSGTIWVGTQENGLNKIVAFDNKNKPVFKKYLPANGIKGALENERVSCLLVDSKKNIWIGTYKGLHLYNKSTDNFTVFTQSNQKGLSNNTILCLVEDYLGNIWVGTQYGITQIQPTKTGTFLFSEYFANQMLPSNYIHAILPDNEGNLWVSTNKGIVKLNYSSNTIAVFDKRDGVQSNIFSENASFKDKNGQLFFGGLEGITFFKPKEITISNYKPKIYFTDLKVNNKNYEYGIIGQDTNLLKKPFYVTDTIILNHKENIFSVDFAALDYHASDKNEYKYMLTGFDNNWVNLGNNRTVSFSNLDAGTYHLKIKASNSDKIWSNDIHQLTITILPPPWRTWWAYTIYVGIFIFLLWLTRYLGLKQQTLKNQLVLARFDTEQEKKLANFKERLFTNISHEFRTPLTLILGPIDDMLSRKKLEVSVEKSLRMVQKQSKRMLRMVNQLLDFQKAEAGNLKLSLQAGEMVSFCYDVFSLFKDEAVRRNIQYTFYTEEKYLAFSFDYNKLEIILFNLLSNAFKFTDSNEQISFSIKKDNNQFCEIIIEDTGKGIPANELDKIFTRFFRGKQEDATTISGTGIGLSFVKELVELHKGTIKAESNGIKGSKFTVKLPPVSNESVAMAEPVTAMLQANTTTQTTINTYAMQNENESVTQEQELPIILVVDDEVDIQEYVYDILSASFKVITASNGKEGLQKAFEIIPDLIISDIMMPEMDGIEMCKALKADKSTSHIPIILLTALNDMAHHVQGIQEGADVYMPKPFNSQLLLVHVHNLINLRNTLKELYAKKIFLGTTNFEIKSVEEEFLFKLMQIVEENISNPDFNNDNLASLMFMSRSTFYRKLKAVTGMSGNEFIRTSRLNYASKLLESGRYSVTEAAFEAGFNDIKYFRKRFQDQFGVTPSEFKK